MIELGRVLAVHRESNSVDVCLIVDGRRLSGVRVMTDTASTNTGTVDLPTVQHAAKDDPTRPLGSREMIAVIGFFSGAAICLGFLHPVVSQLMFPDANRLVYRHASDVYLTIDSAGNTELAHPGGAFVRLGTSSAHEDLTGKDFDGRWKIANNTSNAVHIHVEQAGGVASVDIAPSGAIAVRTSSTADVNASGAITAESSASISLTAPSITLNGNTVINGPLTQGKGSNGGNCAMQGPLNVTHDVTAAGISLQHHVHGGVQGGAGTTGQPQ